MPTSDLVSGKTATIDKIPVQLQLEVNYYVDQPDAFGQEWMIGINVTPAVPNFIENMLKGEMRVAGWPLDKVGMLDQLMQFGIYPPKIHSFG